MSRRHFQDRVNRVSFSPFNQYFIIQAKARTGSYDEAIGSVKDLWGGMVKNGGITTQEPTLKYAAKVAKPDIVTGGNWGGVYGKDGHILCNYDGGGHDRKSLPSYVQSIEYFRAFPKNGVPEPQAWTTGTTDKRALAGDLQNSPMRNATCESNSDNTMSVTIGTDGKRDYQIALYFVDWERKGNRMAVEMFDAETLDLIAPVKIVENHGEGAYLIYKYDKSVKFRINKVRGDSISLSGIFFDSDKD